MRGFFSIGFIDFMPPGKTLSNFTNLFSPYDFEKKWQYNFELFQRRMKLTEQISLIKQNSD